MVIQECHRDLEIVYQIRYRNWYNATDANRTERRRQHLLALNNLIEAGYSAGEIAGIRRHIEMEMERAK